MVVGEFDLPSADLWRNKSFFCLSLKALNASKSCQYFFIILLTTGKEHVEILRPCEEEKNQTTTLQVNNMMDISGTHMAALAG